MGGGKPPDPLREEGLPVQRHPVVLLFAPRDVDRGPPARSPPFAETPRGPDRAKQPQGRRIAPKGGPLGGTRFPPRAKNPNLTKGDPKVLGRGRVPKTDTAAAAHRITAAAAAPRGLETSSEENGWMKRLGLLHGDGVFGVEEFTQPLKCSNPETHQLGFARA